MEVTIQHHTDLSENTALFFGQYWSTPIPSLAENVLRYSTINTTNLTDLCLCCCEQFDLVAHYFQNCLSMSVKCLGFHSDCLFLSLMFYLILCFHLSPCYLLCGGTPGHSVYQQWGLGTLGVAMEAPVWLTGRMGPQHPLCELQDCTTDCETFL